MSTEIDFDTNEKIAQVEFDLFGEKECFKNEYNLLNERTKMIAVDVPLQIIEICREKQLYKPEIDLMIDVLKKRLELEYKLH